MTLSDKQYQILLDLYHELNDVFVQLPQDVQSAFFARLYKRED